MLLSFHSFMSKKNRGLNCPLFFFCLLIGFILSFDNANNNTNEEANPINNDIEIDHIIRRHVFKFLTDLFIHLFARLRNLCKQAYRISADFGEEVFHLIYVLSFKRILLLSFIHSNNMQLFIPAFTDHRKLTDRSELYSNYFRGDFYHEYTNQTCRTYK